MLSPPIITKGYPYPKIVKLASKSANRKLHNSVVANLPTLTEKSTSAKQMCFFQLYSPAASSMHFVRDIAFGSGMRFARWKLQGEYNITVIVANNITTSFASNITLTKSAYH